MFKHVSGLNSGLCGVKHLKKQFISISKHKRFWGILEYARSETRTPVQPRILTSTRTVPYSIQRTRTSTGVQYMQKLCRHPTVACVGFVAGSSLQYKDSQSSRMGGLAAEWLCLLPMLGYRARE